MRRGRLLRVEPHLIRPPSSAFRFTHIHGLTWEDVRDAPPFPEIWRRLAAGLRPAVFLAAHNASFDSRVLRACCETYGMPPPPVRFLCTVKLARTVWRIFPTRLPDVCAHLGIALRHHDPGSDAEAAARIVLAAAARGWHP